MATNHHKLWARHVLALTPGQSTVKNYLDKGEKHSIDILSIATEETKVCATIGLSDIVQWPDATPPVRAEILADSVDFDTPVENVISAAAFLVIKDGRRFRPGTIFADLVSWYLPNLALKHVMFVEPYQWGAEMSRFDAPDGPIFPLLAVPISDNEKQLAEAEGYESLTERWERDDVDVCDWDRPSSV